MTTSFISHLQDPFLVVTHGGHDRFPFLHLVGSILKLLNNQYLLAPITRMDEDYKKQAGPRQGTLTHSSPRPGGREILSSRNFTQAASEPGSRCITKLPACVEMLPPVLNSPFLQSQQRGAVLLTKYFSTLRSRLGGIFFFISAR